jgi:hypothetical protein
LTFNCGEKSALFGKKGGGSMVSDTCSPHPGSLRLPPLSHASGVEERTPFVHVDKLKVILSVGAGVLALQALNPPLQPILLHRLLVISKHVLSSAPSWRGAKSRT